MQTNGMELDAGISSRGLSEERIRVPDLLGAYSK